MLPSSTEKIQPATGAYDTVYSAVIESVLCSSITVWFGSASRNTSTFAHKYDFIFVSFLNLVSGYENMNDNLL